MLVLLLLLFVVSGAAALVYEVVWVRSLTLVFGGSHLAVTTILAVFMGGLALGGFLLGRRADRLQRPLRLYGLLEVGIGVSALAAGAFVSVFPSVYTPLARLAPDSPVWLTLLRVALAVVGTIVPTTLMGGTLPVLSRIVAMRGGRLERHLPLLYGVNTIGAVIGALAAGFVLLPTLGLSRTTLMAVGANLAVGLVALVAAARERDASPRRPEAVTGSGPGTRLVLWGIAMSGFCALGYEVLWTRVLGIVVGTSVYSFTIMLVAFLTGIALGGSAEGLLPRWLGIERGRRRPLAAFAAVQAVIGVAALGTTVALRDLPAHAAGLQRVLLSGDAEFAARQATSFVIAYVFMAVPAFFMGLAFPLAATIHAGRRDAVGSAVGEVLAFNTVGAILGAAGAGLVLVPLVGVERALQVLVLLNVACGLVIAARALARGTGPTLAAAGLALVAILALVAAPARARIWDPKFFAVYRNNQRTAFDTPERVRDALANTDVLYLHEGINETISVIRPRGSAQALLVDGRVEASTHLEDVQCQRALGHLPMLAHPDPRRVFVLGLGTGMTLGSASIHPEVRSITLAEIEPGVFGAARTFGAWNHDVLDDPKLRVVLEDGRTFLRTTTERFDVITADPIHPWSGGAASLYTREAFDTAARRLAPGGVMCQWLPIYELSLDDVRSVVRTFAASFPHVALWLTSYDAELLGSDRPIVLDEALLARRLVHPGIARDLQQVDMGTPRDLLGWFLAADEAVRDFARGGVLNTDDNLWLEFSAPRSQGVDSAVPRNIAALAALRQSPERILTPGSSERARSWSAALAAAPLLARAHALAVAGGRADELAGLVHDLHRRAPGFGPVRFLQRKLDLALAQTPRPVATQRFIVSTPDGRTELVEITAVTMHVGEARGVVVFVDNAVREIYGQRYVDAPTPELDRHLQGLSAQVLDAVRREYARLVESEAAAGRTAPDRARLVRGVRAAIDAAASGDRS